MKKNLQGFSLVELMISIVLGLILMTGVIQMFLSSKSAFSSQQAIARVQETGRLAVEFLSKDVRMAGYIGCASKRKNNVSRLNNSTLFLNNWLNSIQGYQVTDDSGSGAPADASLSPTPLKNTDLFVIRGAFSNQAAITADNTNTTLFSKILTSEVGGCPSSALKMNGFCVGDIVVESDCTAATVFQISAITNAAGVMNVAHTATGSPGNQVATWGGASAVTPDHHYLAGSELFKLNRIIYFIATGVSGRPSLYQKIDGEPSTEVLEGVEDMSITYGTATSATLDAPPDQYRDAAAVTAAGAWSKVLSLRIQLLIQSAEDNVVPEKQTYTFDTDINKVAPDRRLRQVFVSTVGIRSRLP